MVLVSFGGWRACRQFLSTVGVLAVATGVSAACSVGPDFEQPAPPDTTSYLREQPTVLVGEAASGGEAQRLVEGMDIPGQWWTLLQSDDLNALIQSALGGNPTIDEATAALRAAREQAVAQRATALPQIQAGLDVSQNQTAAGLSPVPVTGQSSYGLVAGRLQVTYLLDLWGVNARRTESARALAMAQCFQLQAAYLSLSSSLAVAAIQEAAVREQLRARTTIIGAQRQTLDVLVRQTSAGLITGQEVAAQRAAVAQAEASLPALRKELAQQRNQIAVLAGKLPAAPPSQEFDLSDFRLPANLPLTLPSRLLEHRPDVRASVERLRSASALVGVATANKFPQLTLSGNALPQSLGLDGMLSPLSLGANLGVGLLQTLFDGGALAARKRAAVADYERAQAQYRLTVLNAFREVADSLRALEHDAESAVGAYRAERAAEESLAIARTKLALGDVTYSAVLSAELLYQQTVLERVRAQTNRLLAVVSLFQALGGGWWNTPSASCTDGNHEPTGTAFK